MKTRRPVQRNRRPAPCGLFAQTMAIVLSIATVMMPTWPALAYNQDTHQHLTELAYAYMKLAAGCHFQAMADQASIDDAVNDCVEQAALTHNEEGYTCDCIKDACEPTCAYSNDGQLTIGEAKFDCVYDCVLKHAGANCRNLPECPWPWYSTKQRTTTEVRTQCHDEVYDAAYGKSGDGLCEAIKPLLTGQNGVRISRTNFEQSVRFLQQLQSTPCAPSGYKMEKRAHCLSPPGAGGTTIECLDENGGLHPCLADKSCKFSDCENLSCQSDSECDPTHRCRAGICHLDLRNRQNAKPLVEWEIANLAYEWNTHAAGNVSRAKWMPSGSVPPSQSQGIPLPNTSMLSLTPGFWDAILEQECPDPNNPNCLLSETDILKALGQILPSAPLAAALAAGLLGALKIGFWGGSDQSDNAFWSSENRLPIDILGYLDLTPEQREKVVQALKATANTPANNYTPVVGNVDWSMTNTRGAWLDKQLSADPSVSYTDLTGTILGYHAAVVDTFHDTMNSAELFPIIGYAVATLATAGVAVGGAVLLATSLILVAAFGWIAAIVCALGGSCIDFTQSVSDSIDMLSNLDDVFFDVKNSFSFHVEYTFDDNNVTAYNHFMDGGRPNHGLDTKSVYDDVDGMNFYRGARGNLHGAVVTLEWLWGHVWENKWYYPGSKRTFANHSLLSAQVDDGMSASWPLREHELYWHTHSFFEATVPPIDNMAYYWWHKWFAARNDPALMTEYGLVPLATPLHVVQDLSQPMHAWGVLTNGHNQVEDQLSYHLDNWSCWMDRSGLWAQNTKNQGSFSCIDKTYLDLTKKHCPSASDHSCSFDFVQHITKFVEILHEQTIGADPNGLLRARRLMHAVYNISRKAEYRRRGWAQLDEDEVDENDKAEFEAYLDAIDSFQKNALDPGIDALGADRYDIDDRFLRDVSIPMAVAGSVLLLLEGSTENVPAYVGAMTALASFEDAARPMSPPPVVSNTSTQQKDNSLDAAFASHFPLYNCAQNDAESQALLAEVMTESNEVSIRDVTQQVLRSKARCELEEMGMFDQEVATHMGNANAAKAEMNMTLVANGDLAEYNRRINCHELCYSCGITPAEFLTSPCKNDQPCDEEPSDASASLWVDCHAAPIAGCMPDEVTRLQYDCGGATDTDGDGVPDIRDQCHTPPELVAKYPPTVPIDEWNGCIFAHVTPAPPKEIFRDRNQPFIYGRRQVGGTE